MSRRNRTLAGGWYPFDGKDCKEEIESFLEGWSPPPASSYKGVGGILPHAGWFFSGRLAAKVFYSLKQKAEVSTEVSTIVLYGGHLGPAELPRIITEEAWETPLGEIEIDSDFVKKLTARIELKKESPGNPDNTVEVQLAMVKYFFPRGKLLALRSPSSPIADRLGREVADLAMAEGISIIAIGSTDLTHYGPNYGFLAKGIGPKAVDWVKKENDKGFIDRALKMETESLLTHAQGKGSACSAGAAASAIATCKIFGAESGVLVDYYTSYDIMPDESFVGYAGIIY